MFIHLFNHEDVKVQAAATEALGVMAEFGLSRDCIIKYGEIQFSVIIWLNGLFVANIQYVATYVAFYAAIHIKHKKKKIQKS